MKTSHILIGAIILWNVGLANKCIAQASEFSAPPASADSTQAQAEFIMVQLKDGQWFYGQVVELNRKDLTLTLDTDSLGIMVFHKRHITRTVPGPISANKRQSITGLQDTNGKRTLRSINWRRIQEQSNPQVGRYFFAPSAFQLKKGEISYHSRFLMKSDHLFANEISAGLTDKMTIGTNVMSWLGLGVVGKYGVELTPQVHFAAGGGLLLPFKSRLEEWEIRSEYDWSNWFYYNHRNPIFPLREEPDGPTALVFTTITLGSVRRNFTFNWIKSQYEGNDVNVFNFSALLPISAIIERTWLITEIYAAQNDAFSVWYGSVFAGVRRSNIRRGFSWEFALAQEPREFMAFLNISIPIKH